MPLSLKTGVPHDFHCLLSSRGLGAIVGTLHPNSIRASLGRAFYHYIRQWNRQISAAGADQTLNKQ